MKNWSTTKKILVVLGLLILVALIYNGITNYNKARKEAEAKRIESRVGEVLKDRKLSEEISGSELSSAIRKNLANQPVSEIGVKFYQPSI